MKIFTHLRTLWHEFWMWYHVGPPTNGMGPFDLKRTLHAPLVANAEITNYNSPVGRAMAFPITTLDFDSLCPDFQPTYRVWVYNASRMEHVVDHPILRQVRIPANTTKKRYSLYTSFPNLMKLPQQGSDIYTITTTFMNGEKFVKDLISPDNLYNKSLSNGRDLSVKGVFYSLHNPPLVSEVLAAVTLMKKRYTDLLEQAAVLQEANTISTVRVKDYMVKYECSMETAIARLQVENVKEYITPEHHAAANYFKVTTPWHPVLN
jgi:hypothetical protein